MLLPPLSVSIWRNVTHIDSTSHNIIFTFPHLSLPCLTVGLRKLRTCSVAAILLRLPTAWVSDQQAAVKVQQRLLHLLFLQLAVVFLVIRHQGLGDGLSRGIDLTHLTPSTDADANVNVPGAGGPDDVKRLEELLAQRGGLHEVKRLAVDTNLAVSAKRGRTRHAGLLFPKGLDFIAHLWEETWNK